MSKDNNNTETVITVSDVLEKVNKRLLQSIKVTNTRPIMCVLNNGKGKGKQYERAFKKYQSLSMTVQDVLNIAPMTKLFTGTDGKGSEAALYIEDTEVRQALGFDEINEENGIVTPQDILDNDGVLEILNLSNEKNFKKKIKSFKGDVSKTQLVSDVIKSKKYNDAQRIQYIEKTLSIKIDLEK